MRLDNPTPTPTDAIAAMTPPRLGRRFHAPGVPWSSAIAEDVSLVMVTLHPIGFSELSRNELGVNTGLPDASRRSTLGSSPGLAMGERLPIGRQRRYRGVMSTSAGDSVAVLAAQLDEASRAFEAVQTLDKQDADRIVDKLERLQSQLMEVTPPPPMRGVYERAAGRPASDAEFTELVQHMQPADGDG